MIKNDYILRLIEQMGDFLRQLLAWETSGDFGKCHEEIDAKLQQLGVSRTLLRALPPEELTGLLGRRDESHARRCMLLARLAQADAQVYEAESRPKTALGMYQTALGVLKAVQDEAEPEEQADLRGQMREVEAAISQNIGGGDPGGL